MAKSVQKSSTNGSAISRLKKGVGIGKPSRVKKKNGARKLPKSYNIA